MAEPPRDNRKYRRYWTSLQVGELFTLDGRRIGECVFKDRSDGGARLFVPGQTIIPEKVRLQDLQHNTTHVAQVRWKRGQEIGVQYETAVTSHPRANLNFTSQSVQGVRYQR